MELRYYQREACDAAWNAIRNNHGNPLIDLPTGSGKSLVAAELAREAVQDYSGRVLVLAHRKELVEQNAAKLKQHVPGIDVGIYQAALRSRDTDHSVVFAGIQSVWKRAYEFGRRHLIVIDEAHLIPRSKTKDEEESCTGMYQRFLADLARANSPMHLVGLTATPYRLDSGALYGRGELFSHVCYQANLRRLIEEGFLCGLTNRPTTQYDLAKIQVRYGEFAERQVQDLFGQQKLIEHSVRELVAATQDRHSIIVFTTGVRHAEDVAGEIAKASGEEVEVITGKTPELFRQATIDRFRARRLRWLVSIDCLTTGLDVPCIDCVAVLRATLSPGLFAQMLGRGLRLDQSKENCLVLDFGGNLDRHGPLDDPGYGVHRNKTAGGEAMESPVKLCPACRFAVPPAVRYCPECNFRFPEPQVKHEEQADTTSQIISTPETFRVESVKYARHQKRGNADAIPTLRVDYICQREEEIENELPPYISEWICLEHPLGPVKAKAIKWWTDRSVAHIPKTIDEAVDLCNAAAISETHRILAKREGKFWRILKYDLGPKPTEWELIEADVFAEEDVPF